MDAAPEPEAELSRARAGPEPRPARGAGGRAGAGARSPLLLARAAVPPPRASSARRRAARAADERRERARAGAARRLRPSRATARQVVGGVVVVVVAGVSTVWSRRLVGRRRRRRGRGAASRRRRVWVTARAAARGPCQADELGGWREAGGARPLAPVAGGPKPDPDARADRRTIRRSSRAPLSTAVTRASPGGTRSGRASPPGLRLAERRLPAVDGVGRRRSKVLLIVIAWLGSKPSVTRLRLSSATSRPSVTPADKRAVGRDRAVEQHHRRAIDLVERLAGLDHRPDRRQPRDRAAEAVEHGLCVRSS